MTAKYIIDADSMTYGSNYDHLDDTVSGVRFTISGPQPMVGNGVFGPHQHFHAFYPPNTQTMEAVADTPVDIPLDYDVVTVYGFAGDPNEGTNSGTWRWRRAENDQWFNSTSLYTANGAVYNQWYVAEPGGLESNPTSYSEYGTWDYTKVLVEHIRYQSNGWLTVWHNGVQHMGTIAGHNRSGPALGVYPRFWWYTNILVARIEIHEDLIPDPEAYGAALAAEYSPYNPPTGPPPDPPYVPQVLHHLPNFTAYQTRPTKWPEGYSALFDGKLHTFRNGGWVDETPPTPEPPSTAELVHDYLLMRSSDGQSWTLTVSDTGEVETELIVPPANNTIETAEALTVGGSPYEVDLTYAPSDGQTQGGQVWLTWVAPSADDATFDTSPSAPPLLDTVLIAYTASTATPTTRTDLTQVAYSDDNGTNKSTLVITAPTPDTKYWIELRSYYADSNRQGVATLTYPDPASG